ncbi:MAG TPA: hypothetical protein VLA12_05545 [Planctomycetaceae bacterium]|nr:hypothetical protein [Planctomycetaceae bacterium]
MTLRNLVVILIVVCFGETSAFAQDSPSPNGLPATNPVDGQPSSAAQSTELNDEQQEKKRQIDIGMILVGGILILGIFLLVLTLLVSRRLKRTAASGRQPSQPRDELWYLKNPPAHVPPDKNEGSE